MPQGHRAAGSQAPDACSCPESSMTPLSRPPVAPGLAGRPVTEQSGKSPIHTRFLQRDSWLLLTVSSN